MSTPTIAVILIALFVLLIIFWLVRSRGNTVGHIDTTLTAVGAATEAVEDIVEIVTHKAEPGGVAEIAVVAEAPAKKAPAKKAPAKKAPVKKAATPKAVAPKTPAKKAPAAKAKRAADPVAAETASAEILAGGNDTAMLPIGIAAAEGAPDNLQQLKGVGPKLASLLTELGIARFDQIAAWSPADVEKVDVQLGAFKGRVTRDHWIEQAGHLAKGDIAGFESKFGKLDG